METLDDKEKKVDAKEDRAGRDFEGKCGDDQREEKMGRKEEVWRQNDVQKK